MDGKKRYVYLDGIRGVAALIVVMSHLQHFFFPDFGNWLFDVSSFSSFSGLFWSVVNFCLDGDMAVYIFWFMSAYVISGKIFTDNNRDYLVSAFSKRYFRLLIPAFGSVLLAYVLLEFGLMYNIQLEQSFGEQFHSDWLLSQNNFEPSFWSAIKSGIWNTFFNYQGAPTYNTSLWTMSFELYGSLICFALGGILAGYARRFWVYGFIFIVGFLLAQYWLCSFLLGLIVCDIDNAGRALPIHSGLQRIDNLLNRWWVSVPIFFMLIVIGGRGNYFQVANMFLSAAIVFTIMRSNTLQWLFDRPLVRWLGRISFPLYLLHVPILCSLSSYLFLVLEGSYAVRALIASAAGVVVALVAATAYLPVDDFAVRLANRFGYWAVLSPRQNR